MKIIKVINKPDSVLNNKQQAEIIYLEQLLPITSCVPPVGIGEQP